MESIKIRLNHLENALMRLNDSLLLLNKPESIQFHVQFRDSVIQSFEFSYDLFWKCLKDLLFEKYGITVASPKKVFREAFDQEIIDEKTYLLFSDMTDDRNDTAHRYDEAMAEKISKKAFTYHQAMLEAKKRIEKL